MATPFDPLTYCSPEDLALEAEADLPNLVARTPAWARGSDGAIANGSPWSLTSAAVDFGARGVPAGALVVLTAAPQTAAYASTGPDGYVYAVDAVAGHALTLRQPGMTSGQGEPPGAVASLAGLVFTVPNLDPILTAGANWLRQQLNWDVESDLIAAADLREVALYDALQRLYRGASQTPGDNYDKMAAQYRTLRDEALTELKGRRRALYPTDSLSVVPLDLSR